MLLEGWEAVSRAAPLARAEEAKHIRLSWSPVRVPGHWQLEDAFAAYEGYVLYRCRFEGRLPRAAEMLTLRFGGVYYSARVWLNGIYLGDHEGYFAPFEFDCTDVVVEGKNELLVEVYSPEEPDENDRKTVGGVWARWDEPAHKPRWHLQGSRSYLRWRGSYPVLGGPSRSFGTRASFRGSVRQTESGDQLAGLVRPLEFEAPGAELEEDVRVEPGCNRFEIDFFLPRPQLWWTWDRGEQPLYELILGCTDGEKRVRFRVRSLDLRGWKVYLNGQRIFLRGINYLPTDAYPARASEKQVRSDAALVREANMNSVRVHVHVAEESFYAACNELGV